MVCRLETIDLSQASGRRMGATEPMTVRAVRKVGSRIAPALKMRKGPWPVHAGEPKWILSSSGNVQWSIVHESFSVFLIIPAQENQSPVVFRGNLLCEVISR